MSENAKQVVVEAVNNAPNKDQIIAEILQKGLETAQRVGDFAVEQGTDLIHQLILFKTVQYGTFTFLGLFLMFMAGYCALWAVRAGASRHYYRDDANAPRWWKKADGLYRIDFEGWGWVLVVLSGIFGSIMFLYNVSSFLKILLAPKVWLLEYTVNLIKSAS
jgi:hypothetical protein